jgi:hypothetical protein
LEASAARARSAEEYVSMQLTSLYNLTTDQIDSSHHFGRSNVGIGSSQLTNNLLSLSEAQRAANRRVVITAFIYDL